MKRRITTFLLSLLLPLVLAAQNHQADIDRLTKEMYRLYSSHEIEQFMSVTDQLKEAEDINQNQFGDDHMLDILRHTKFRDARHVVELMEEEVRRHRNGAEANDDMTIMCLKALKTEK